MCLGETDSLCFPSRAELIELSHQPPRHSQSPVCGLDLGWTTSTLMRGEFPSWRRRRRPALHLARLLLELRDLCQQAWLWDPSLLARDCLGTVTFELIWGALVFLGRMGVWAALSSGLQRTGLEDCK